MTCESLVVIPSSGEDRRWEFSSFCDSVAATKMFTSLVMMSSRLSWWSSARSPWWSSSKSWGGSTCWPKLGEHLIMLDLQGHSIRGLRPLFKLVMLFNTWVEKMSPILAESSLVIKLTISGKKEGCKPTSSLMLKFLLCVSIWNDALSSTLLL